MELLVSRKSVYPPNHANGENLYFGSSYIETTEHYDDSYYRNFALLLLSDVVLNAYYRNKIRR
jgi:hypothetical protein